MHAFSESYVWSFQIWSCFRTGNIRVAFIILATATALHICKKPSVHKLQLIATEVSNSKYEREIQKSDCMSKKFSSMKHISSYNEQELWPEGKHTYSNTLLIQATLSMNKYITRSFILRWKICRTGMKVDTLSSAQEKY